MLSTLRNAWKVPELKKRFLWTIFLIAVFRIGTHIPVPGMSSDYLQQLAGQQGSLFGFYDLISGGAFSNTSIFALSVSPYITASIIMQLLTIAIPSLETLSKEGEHGKKKIQKITKYTAVVLALIQAFSIYAPIRNAGGVADNSAMAVITIIFSLVVGSTLAMWIGDQITERGFGNGVSILIFVNIVSRLPLLGAKLFGLKQGGTVSIIEIALFIVGAIALLALVVYFSLAERRIPVQYAGKAVGNKIMKSQSTHIPLSIVGTAVIAIIFSMSVMMMPRTVAEFFTDHSWAQWIITNKSCPFNPGSWMYVALNALFTIGFSWFYTIIQYKPDQMAENLNKSAGFVPGIRPGEQTEKYFEKVLTRVSLITGIFAAFIAILPMIIENWTKLQGLSFGGTTLLIVVNVGLDFSRKLDSQLVMRHYQGFLK